jgi:hypothetical protein
MGKISSGALQDLRYGNLDGTMGESTQQQPQTDEVEDWMDKVKNWLFWAVFPNEWHELKLLRSRVASLRMASDRRFHQVSKLIDDLAAKTLELETLKKQNC